jgi:plastocyanin
VTINGGDAVNWTDNTVVSHTVTRCGAAPGQNDSGCPAIGATGNNGSSSDQFNSPPLAANGGTYSHTFSGAGSYTYYCTIHGYSVMHGTVTVNAAATSATPAASPSPGGGTNPAASPAASPASLARTGGGPAARPRGGWLPIATALFILLALGALFATAVVTARARTLR